MSAIGAKKALPIEKVILGIDPGTQVFGYGIIQQEGIKMTAVQLGVVKLEKFKSQEIRLAKIFEKVTQLIEEFLPDEMAIEAPFLGKMFSRPLNLVVLRALA
jgi:crossover junction endodeoxyribonuclease RuvC